MRGALLLLTLLLSITSHSQNKKETQDWIIEKIEMYQHSSGASHFKYSISFSETEMIVQEDFKVVFEDFTSHQSYKTIKIPIKELHKIRFKGEDGSKSVSIVLRIKGNKKNIQVIHDIGTENRDEYSFVLHKSVITDGLDDRFKKAFDKLIVLYGGTLTNEAF